jgi:hypothetical protein
VDAQVVLRTRLRREAESAYAAALADFDDGTCEGRLLVGEVLARWQDYAASGDLSEALRGRRGISALRRGGKRARTDATTTRYAALETALRDAVAALVVSVADRAAEQVTFVWRDNPGGAALLAAADASRLRDERAAREFESAFGPPPDENAAAGGAPARQGAFDRSAPDLPLRVSRAVSAWQDQLMRLMQSEATRWPGGGAVHDIAPVAVVAMVAMLGMSRQGGGMFPAARETASAIQTASEGKDGIGSVPREVLASVVGNSESEALVARARKDLHQRVGLLLDEELLRFGEVIDEMGPVDAVASVRLYQAEYALEATR